MTHRWILRAAGLAAAVLVAVAAFGCSKSGTTRLVPNSRPTVTLTSAPIDSRDTTFYAYQISWSGYDEDGRVDHYIYAIDPTPTDTTWTTTTKNNVTQFFTATHAVLGGPITSELHSVDHHTFVIKAVDNQGLASAPIWRTFFSYTVAPSVNITAPRPSPTSTALVTPAMRVTWTGVDPDGQTRQKPVKYKYKLLPRGNTEFDIDFAVTGPGPDSLRRYYEARNFAGWDSIGGDTTTVQYTGLTPGQTYLFVLIGIDEAGAYNANFTTDTNVLLFSVGYAGTLGPKITVFNEFFVYNMPTGGFAPNNPATWQYVEVPSGQQLTFNWFATAPAGADIDWYRWRIGGDVGDETPRTNEATDWAHWSQKSASTVSCTIGPYNTSVPQTLYIEAQDNNGMLSILVVILKPIVPTLNKSLLIVDDTRLEVDQFVGGIRKKYGQNFPARAELDTLLFARGGFPYQGLIPPAAGTSTAGIFNGYSYDTLGTRLGYSNAASGVPFSLLSQYRHVIWMVDKNGGSYTASPTQASQPMSTLHYMCTPGHNNTFSTYTYAGGRMWLLGGGAAIASLREFNATGADNNDRDYAPISGWVFAGAGYAHHQGKEELVPGRLMYDGAKWQSLMMCQSSVAKINRSTNLMQYPASKWVAQPGYNYVNPVTRPDYTLLPATMHTRSNPASDPVNGEPIPLTRTSSDGSNFWSVSPLVDLEYLLQPNYIIEDMNSDPVAESLEVALDTLMSVQSNGIVNGGTGYDPAVMTWYHDVASPEFIFSGFPIWSWRRTDVQQLVDFVLQQIWHLSKSSSSPAVASRPNANPAGRTAPPSSPAAGRFHLPTWHSGGK